MFTKGAKVLECYKGIPLYIEDDGLVAGQIASVCVDHKDKPDASWTGTQIPDNILLECASFSKWCADTYGGEVQGRLYYERSTGRWASACVEQWVSRSLESQEIKSDGNIEEALKQLPDGVWNQMGTWHSHVNIKAYQSKTDYDDEITQNGVHVTFGKLGDDVFDIHTRITHMGINYDKGNGLDNEILSDSMCLSTKDLPDFPEIWIDTLKERPPKEKAKPKSTATARTGSSVHVSTYGDVLEINDDQYGLFVSMARMMFPDVEPDEVFRRMSNMHVERQYMQSQFDFDSLEDHSFVQWYSCLCGNETRNPDCICDECLLCM